MKGLVMRRSRGFKNETAANPRERNGFKDDKMRFLRQVLLRPGSSVSLPERFQ